MTFRLANSALSDLFFNYRHDHRDAYYQHTKPDERDGEAERAALHDDATEFSDMINGATGNMFIDVTPNDYVNDFFARL